MSTRRMEKLVAALGIARLPKRQLSRMAADLDAVAEQRLTEALRAAGRGDITVHRRLVKHPSRP